MKKLIITITIIVLSLTLVSCSNNNKTDESTEGAAENEVAKSLIHQDHFEGIEFRVAEGWERIETEGHLLFNAGYSSMVFGVTDDGDSETLVFNTLASIGFNANTIEYKDDKEDVELTDITGTKQGFTIDTFEGEVFIFTIDSRTYCLIAVFTDSARQLESFEAIDTLFSSITIKSNSGNVASEEAEGTEPIQDTEENVESVETQ